MPPTVYGQNDPIMAELRALLVSAPVQKIQFRFGPMQLLAADFRELARKLADSASTVSAAVDPDRLDSLGAGAGYDAEDNQFVFRDELIFRDARGRGEAVHEAVHAIYDLRDRMSMKLSQESVCYLAGAMYHVVTGTEAIFKKVYAANICDIAAAIHARGGASVPEATLAERLEMRRTLRGNRYRYKRGLTKRKGGFSNPYLL